MGRFEWKVTSTSQKINYFIRLHNFLHFVSLFLHFLTYFGSASYTLLDKLEGGLITIMVAVTFALRFESDVDTSCIQLLNVMCSNEGGNMYAWFNFITGGDKMNILVSRYVLLPEYWGWVVVVETVRKRISAASLFVQFELPTAHNLSSPQRDFRCTGRA